MRTPRRRRFSRKRRWRSLWEESRKRSRRSEKRITAAWGDLPDAVVHTTIAKLKAHPDYAAAKAGAVRPALAVVQSLLKIGKLEELQNEHPNALLVPVRAEEARAAI